MSDHNITNFTQIFEQNYDLFINHADKITHNKEDSHDVVHDVFMKIWNNPPDMRIPEAIKSYFMTSIRNTCFKLLSQNQQLVYRDFDIDLIVGDNFLDEIISLENDEKFNKITQSIPTRRRQVLECAMEGMKNSEIAKHLNISTNTVKTHKRLAKKTFYDNL